MDTRAIYKGGDYTRAAPAGQSESERLKDILNNVGPN